jgi:hypothetical protein
MPQKQNREEHNKEMAIAMYTIKLDTRKSPIMVVRCLPVQLLMADCIGDSVLKYHLKCAEICHLYGYCYPEGKLKKHVKRFLAIWAQN